MKIKNSDILMQNSVFVWIALTTGLILLVPFLAMQFNWPILDPGSSTLNGVDWSLSDFITMGTLLFGASSLFVLIARVTARKYRVLVGAAVLAIFLYLWAELAVGIFTNWGS